MFSKRKFLTLVIALAMVFALVGCAGEETPPVDDDQGAVEPQGEIILATTTSTNDSGLLEYILPDFLEKTGWKANIVSVGSGDAMKMGKNGEADVLLVHSPKDEAAFVEEGHADSDGRFDVMFNDFVLVGPKADPAKIAATGTDAIESFKKLSEQKATFISRGDDSGTHKKELSIWEKATITPTGDWYVSAGTGMGAVITMANETLAYTLADRATWLTAGKDTDLAIVCEKDPSGVMNNQYGVICVNPEKNANIQAEGAKAFQEWILSKETQELIGTFGVEEYGNALFTPNAK